MSFIETQYISLIASALRGFKKTGKSVYNFACPYCGDSKKSKTKLRGYLFQRRNDYFFKCHNCGVGRTLGNFIKDHDHNLYERYVLERFSAGLTGKKSVVKTPEIDYNNSNPDGKFKANNYFQGLTPISNLNTETYARSYLDNRKIPDYYYKNLYFCEQFKSWANQIKPIFSSITPEESRIIIPLADKDGIFGFQARSLNPKATIRYLTLLVDENKPKLYGLNKVDDTKTVYVTEGPFDSMFLPNAISMCGSDIDLELIPCSDLIFVMDNEPRNLEIVNKIKKLIDQKQKVVIWPSYITQKDINDMHLANVDYLKVIQENTFHGLTANLQLDSWKKA